MSEFNEELIRYMATHEMRSRFSDSDHAKKIMLELVKAGYADFLLLRDDDISKWWDDIVSIARSGLENQKEKIRLYKIKSRAYERLSPEDRKILGLKKPIKPKYPNIPDVDLMPD